MTYSKMTDEHWKYPALEARRTGDLTVSESPLHVMHWQEYGNPQGEPVIFIHGGPGGEVSAKYARFFNPERYRVILYDQRGCGLSKPHIAQDMKAALADNDTAHLVQDIEILRDHLGITGKAHIFGGSWGSTLAMAYAQAHPEHVQDLILRGIFLSDANDLGYFYQGNASDLSRMDMAGAYRAYTHDGEYTIPAQLHDDKMAAAYAKAWNNYVRIIPENARGDIIGAYHAIFHSHERTPEEKLDAAIRWSVWEGVASYLNHDVSDLGKFADPHFALAFATIENEFFTRALRGQDRLISDLMIAGNIAKLAAIPTYIVQGAHDQVCVPSSARTLKLALEQAGAKLHYVETPAGHSMMEKTTNAELVRIMDALPRM